MTPNAMTDIIAMQLRAENNIPFKRAVLARANTIREQMLKRTLEKTPEDRKYFIQPIRIPLHDVNMLEGTGLTKVRSENDCPLPRVLRANSILFDYLGALDGSNAFQYTAPGHEFFHEHHPYAKNTTRYRMEGRKLVVLAAGVPEVLGIGIYADPEVAFNIDAKANACQGCDFWESEYPCTGDVIDLIIQEITTKWHTQPVNLEANGTENQVQPNA